MKEKRTIQGVKNQIAGFFRERKRMPTYEEMVTLLGVKSKSVVRFWVDKLVAAEILERDSAGRLAWRERPFSIPLVGEVTAGFPSPEEEELRDILSLDEYLVTRPEASFLLQVSGDSMIGEVIERKIKNKPFMMITIDEHTGEAGMVTRLEAFCDMLLRRRGNTGEDYISAHG